MNWHGYLSFVPSVYQYVKWGKQIPQNDPPFLAPLYFEALYAGELEIDRDGIYYRMITSESQLLKNLTLMVRESMVGANRFTAENAFIATWDRVRSRSQLSNIGDKMVSSKILEIGRELMYK